MLKFKNMTEGVEAECRVAAVLERGGVHIELDVMPEKGVPVSEDIYMTPMDAAYFLCSVSRSSNPRCPPVGHSAEGATFSVRERNPNDAVSFVGLPFGEEYVIEAGAVKMAVTTPVLRALAAGIERMMCSLLFPTTGDEEEEFGKSSVAA